MFFFPCYFCQPIPRFLGEGYFGFVYRASLLDSSARWDVAVKGATEDNKKVILIPANDPDHAGKTITFATFSVRAGARGRNNAQSFLPRKHRQLAGHHHVSTWQHNLKQDWNQSRQKRRKWRFTHLQPRVHSMANNYAIAKKLCNFTWNESFQGSFYLVLEYCSHGSLLNFLRTHDHKYTMALR